MGKKNKKNKKKKESEDSASIIENKEENDMIMKVMKFKSFGSTKNKSHVDSDLSGAFKGKYVKREYKQYMNKKGGFNKNFLNPQTANNSFL